MTHKFRKKPVVVEAVQWTGYNGHEIIKFVGQNLHFSQPPSGYKHSNDDSLELLTIQIPTLEGVMTANQMDWIIKGVNGEFYPCKPDIFEKTYEAVNKDAEIKTEQIIEDIEARAEKPFVTARFGDSWVSNYKQLFESGDFDIDTILKIAWINGRRCVLMERAIYELNTKISNR